MKNVLLACVVAIGLSFVTGCKNEEKGASPSASNTSSSPTKTSAATSAAPAVAAAPVGNFADPSTLKEKAPDTFKAQFDTTKGKFVIEVKRDLSPNGADRFYNLVRSGYFKDVAFFRVIPGFMAQFGIHGDPKVSAAWRPARIDDEPVKAGNTRGAITFAKGGPNSRTTQLFINFADNSRLDAMGFPSFGKVVEGMDVVDKINGEYGDGAPNGRGPDQGRIQAEGNAFLKKDFPNLDYINSATIVQ
jgi:peptidyl-prolyl cis-trans isomerase A (cyclophilin A)